MEVHDKENQFKIDPIVLPAETDFFVIVGGNNSGKSTFLRNVIKNQGKGSSYLVNVNRTVLTGEGSLKKDYQSQYPSLLNAVMTKNDDNYERNTQPLQDLFNLKDGQRKLIIEWYNMYFPSPIVEEREDPDNSASPMMLKINDYPITSQGSGVRATLEIFIKLFDSNIKILCIDEPELGLEPFLQKYLFNALKEKASPDKKIIIATHSHHFLDSQTIGNNFICSRDSDNKIILEIVTDLQPVIFRLLGNTLSSFLLPERILVLEGSSDTTFLLKCLELLSKNGYAIHNSNSDGNISYAINSITQFLRFNSSSLPVYKEKVFVIVDRPTRDVVVRQWKILLGDDSRLKPLSKNGIEYYYPERILQLLFDSTNSRQVIVDSYLRSNPNGYNNIQLSKNSLAKKVAENLKLEDMDENGNELFNFIKLLP